VERVEVAALMMLVTLTMLMELEPGWSVAAVDAVASPQAAHGLHSGF